MRLQPHFLFNSLQNISVLVQHDPRRRSRMLTKLGDLLRASLRRDGEAETTLETEIALTSAYLAVEQMRFGDRLSSSSTSRPGTDQAQVPTFLLQPLVENAIRHGLEPAASAGSTAWSRSGAARRRRARADRHRQRRRRPRRPVAGAYGIGLGATCERLARMYPGAHTFALRARPEGGTEARITLPAPPRRPTEVPGDALAARAHRRR